MLSNAFSPLPRRPQPEATNSETISSTSSTPQMSQSTPHTLSRPASDLLASDISASTLLDAANESTRLLAIGIQHSEKQRQDLITARAAAKEKPLNSTIGRAPSFSRPRPMASSERVGRDIGAMGEIGERLVRLRKEEERLKGDIEWLKQYISQGKVGGRKNRLFIVEDEPEQENETEEEELGEDDEIPEEMMRGQLLGSVVRDGRGSRW